ncbi:MAG: lipopolysaccharide biosynthesis protein [Nitrososphaerales archaeon]
MASLIGAGFWLTMGTLTDVKEFGEANYFLSLASILSSASLLGLHLATMTYLPKGDQRLVQQAAVIVVFTNAAVSIPFLIVSQYLPSTLMILGTSFYAMTIADVLGRKKYRSFLVLKIGERAVQFALSILLYLMMGVNGMLIGYGVALLIFSYGFFKELKYSVSSIAGRKLVLSGSKSAVPNVKTGTTSSHLMRFTDAVKPKLKFITHAYAMSLAQSSTSYADKLIIGPVFGFYILGLYQLGFQILLFAGVVPLSLGQYLLPQEASGAQGNRVKKIGLIFSISLALILYLSLDWLINSFYPRYTEAIVPAKVMIIGIIPATINAILNSELLGREQSKPVLISSISYVISLFLLIYILGTNFGLMGLSVALVSSLSLQSIVLWLLGRSKKQNRV